jgi:hypothetical protein
MHTHINATATANTNVDISRHLDCFIGRGFEIRKSTPSSMSLRFPVGTSISEMRDAFAAGLIALLLKLPKSGASQALANPIRVRVSRCSGIGGRGCSCAHHEKLRAAALEKRQLRALAALPLAA